jgi:hypothetical protein
MQAAPDCGWRLPARWSPPGTRLFQWPTSASHLPTVPDAVWRALCGQLDGSRDLVLALAEGRTPNLVLHAIEGTLTGADEADLARLRAGLDRIGGRR